MPQKKKTFITPNGLEVDEQGNILTSETLKPTPTIDPVQPEPTPIVAPTEPPQIPDAFAPTPQETEQSELIKRARGITEELTGETAFRRTQEEEFGIQQKREELQKMQSRIQALQAEAQQIPLQLQQEAKGRGITAGGLRPLETARLRTNTIAQLGANAAFQAAAGNLALAQDFVDRAVEAEFGTRKAELDAILQNIELIKADPATTLAEQKRATETERRLQQEQADIEAASATKKAIGRIMTEVAGLVDDETLVAIQNAVSEEHALRLAAPALGLAKQADIESKLNKNRIDKLNAELLEATNPLKKEKLRAEINEIYADAAERVQEGEAGTTDPQKSLDQLTFLRDTVASAKSLAKASGKAVVTKFLGDVLIGDTRFRRLESFTNTLRTNVLTLMTDPSVKKFFGPQMSEADVRLMTAAGTTLNPELQSPADMEAELTRLDDLFQRMQEAIPTEGENPFADVINQTGGQFYSADQGYLIPQQ